MFDIVCATHPVSFKFVEGIVVPRRRNLVSFNFETGKELIKFYN